MIKNIIWTIILAVVAGILQSTILGNFALFGAVPDLALCILVYSAYVNGTMTGQLSGFFSGLLLDFLSVAPLGLNCLIRTVIGAVTGIFKGAFFLDVFFLPFILCALATIAKALIMFLLNFIMGSMIPVYSLFSILFWIELGLNSLCAPVLFLLLKHFRFITPKRS
jgi:rod shape-determining protein MreD